MDSWKAKRLENVYMVCELENLAPKTFALKPRDCVTVAEPRYVVGLYNVTIETQHIRTCVFILTDAT